MAKPALGSVPFKEAKDYFESKKVVSASEWLKLTESERARAFFIGGVTKLDMANDFHTALADIRQRGGTVQDFIKDFEAISKRYGWDVNNTNSWRARLIYENNNRIARSAGKWQQIQRRQERKRKRDPNYNLYLQYRVLDHDMTRRRELHQTWHLITLPADHKWWITHYPPNGHFCACWVRVLTQEQVDREGIEIKDPPPMGWTEQINKRTGEIYPPTPEGIDVGFAVNHGEVAYFPSGARLSTNDLRQKLAQLTIDSPDFNELVSGRFGGTATVGFLVDDIKDQIGAKTNRVVLTDKVIKKQLSEGTQLKVSDFKNLRKLVSEGLIIKSGGKVYSILFTNSGTYQARLGKLRGGKEIQISDFKKITQRQVSQLRRKGKVISEPI